MRSRCPHCGEEIELVVRKPHPRTARHEEVMALLKFGATQTEVAAVLGVSKQRVNQIAKANGR